MTRGVAIIIMILIVAALAYTRIAKPSRGPSPSRTAAPGIHLLLRTA